jgi:endonuclease/exonuclease/phosphatase family metal-dependent hydrolase
MTSFKIMTWNLENLFLAGGDFGPKTPELFQQKLEVLAKVILRLDPDVLAVQEVGEPAAFDELVAKLQGRYPHAILSNHPDLRGIRVGFLSKLQIEEPQDIVGFPAGGLASVPGIDSQGNPTPVTQFGRGALGIRVRPKPDFSVHLITTHLKSKLLTYPSPPHHPRFEPMDENERARVAGFALLRRTAEAAALRVEANKLVEKNSQNALIVLGDMNDVVDAATTQILNGPSGSEIGTPGFQRRDRGDDARLFNLAPCIPEARRFSRIHHQNKELIDHIFVSEELLPGHPRKTPEVDSHVDVFDPQPLPSIGDDPKKRQGEPGSDHAPVTAIFEL